MKKAFQSCLILASLFLMSGHAGALCVKVPEANLREGPGTKYEKTWQVFKYMPLRKVAKKGGWYKVKDVDGDLHWIYGNLVTGRFKCAVVRVDEANIRTGPGTNYAKTATSPALRYYSYKVIKLKGDWVNVKDEYGNAAWIFGKLLWIQ